MTRTLVLLVLTLVVALAALGVGYGLWSKTLTIGGTVQTGDLDAVWFYASCDETEDKPVGEYSVAPDPDDQQILVVTLDNVYPSYLLDCEIHFGNKGTIPVKTMTDFDLENPNPDEITVGWFNGSVKQLEPCYDPLVWGTNPLSVPANCQKAFSLIIHVEQEAKERTEYTFNIHECVHQWNENPTFGECQAAAGDSEP